ncbi:hypothetical protein E2C01_037919 [Portunus trituberculatus]|uniref:Uncharacterized protein n=1 Tax=Portunus trituberculatus TaxID=210409 RepID=A0A5B7F9F1_PORTR|nr:hypothetical protein [Portunus trituberculatus]
MQQRHTRYEAPVPHHCVLLVHGVVVFMTGGREVVVTKMYGRSAVAGGGVEGAPQLTAGRGSIGLTAGNKCEQNVRAQERDESRQKENKQPDLTVP